MIINQDWLDKQKVDENGNEEDAYVMGIIRVAEKSLTILEAIGEGPIDADAIISKAGEGEGITGNMAAYVAYICVKCHSRGEEFRKSWNTYWNRPDAEGVINPAVVTVGEA